MQTKSVDWKQKIYHMFKLSNSLYVLYDDEMDMPIKYGALNDVTPVINSLRKHISGVFIIYYDRDLQDKISFKKNLLKTRVNNEKSTAVVLSEDRIHKA